MKLTRTDLTSLAAIALGGIIGIVAFGPGNFISSRTVVTTDWEYAPVSLTVEDVEVSVVEGDVVSESILIAGRAGGPSEPLVYVDGVRLEGMPELDPDAIERIEVLKGLRATERFGEEASSGVIQIFLKRDVAPDPRR